MIVDRLNGSFLCGIVQFTNASLGFIGIVRTVVWIQFDSL